MELREKRLADEVVGYTCDICGQPCFTEEGPNRESSTELAILRAEWGFWSEKDGSVHECQMCEQCFDKVRAFIENELKGKVRVHENWSLRPESDER